MTGEQQVEPRGNQQHERNRVHEGTSAAQPEQARTSEQRGNNQHDVADEQSGINSVYNYDQTYRPSRTTATTGKWSV
jgi:hypothetical protein